MSSIKLSPNASGTGEFTIAAPNSNTNRTLTLPDATGTIQVSGNAISGTTGTFTGLLDISAAGAGQIQFPATQNASSNANTLDDYEEGTFTPTITTTGSNFSSVTYVSQSGRYTKIGDTVFVALRVIWSAASGGSGDVRIGGLPFAAGDSYTSFALCNYHNVVANNDFQMRSNSDTTLAPQITNGSSGVGVSTFTSGTFNKTIAAAGCYKI